MGQIANIVINDGQATPVAHTFAPNGNSGTEANYVDRANGISIGFPSLKTTLAVAGRNQPLNKIRVKLVVPRLEQIAGNTAQGYTPAPRLSHVLSFDGTFIFHERATEQERKDVRTLLTNLFGHAQMVDLIDKLSPAY